MMFNTVFKTGLVSVWLLCMGWLIRYEAFPHWFDDTVQGYKSLSRDLPAIRDTWMKVMAEGKHVGYVNSSIEMEDQEGQEMLLMSTQLLLRIDLQGVTEMLRLHNKVRLNSRHELTGSESSFSLGRISGQMNITGTEKNEIFDVAAQLNEIQFNRQIRIPAGAVLFSPLMDAGMRSVRPGRSLKIRTLDPFSFSGELQTVEIKGLSSERRLLEGEEREVLVTRVAVHVGDLVLYSEVDEFGRVLRQETPFGLIFVQSTAQQAMKVPPENNLNPLTLISSPAFPTMMNLP
ncbi:MAG: hypothetical protein WD708_04250, partial [Kiritimatiellia bacterium]